MYHERWFSCPRTLCTADSTGLRCPFSDPHFHFSLSLFQTFKTIFNKVVENRLPSGARPTMVMFDCCPKEEAGFNRSLLKQRGTLMCWCYFHFKKAWSEAVAQKMQGDGQIADLRDDIMNDLDRIVWTEVRRCIHLSRFGCRRRAAGQLRSRDALQLDIVSDR